jgi:hypothetical protein
MLLESEMCQHCGKEIENEKGEQAVTIKRNICRGERIDDWADYGRWLVFHLSCFLEVASAEYVPGWQEEKEMPKMECTHCGSSHIRFEGFYSGDNFRIYCCVSCGKYEFVKNESF